MKPTRPNDAPCNDPRPALDSTPAQPPTDLDAPDFLDGQDHSIHSQLDPVETSADRIRCPLVPPTDDDNSLAVQNFRHSFWSERRNRVRESITKLSPSEEVIRRFDTCGSNCWVMRATDNSGRLRLAADRCHNRWCEACQVEKRRLIARNLTNALTEQKTAGDRLRFITVTLKTTDTPLTDQLDRIYAAWRKLCQHPKIKPHIAGTISFFEVTLSMTTRLWHPHIHALVDGTYIAKDLLSQVWKEITTDSFIIDIKQIRNAAAAAGYVAKYASKAVSHYVWNNAERLEEAMFALRSRRLFNTTGTFRKMNLSQPPPDDVGWEALAPLHVLIAKARNGDADATHILRALRSSSNEDPIDAYMRPGPSPPVSHLPF